MTSRKPTTLLFSYLRRRTHTGKPTRTRFEAFTAPEPAGEPLRTLFLERELSRRFPYPWEWDFPWIHYFSTSLLLRRLGGKVMLRGSASKQPWFTQPSDLIHDWTIEPETELIVIVPTSLSMKNAFRANDGPWAGQRESTSSIDPDGTTKVFGFLF